MQKVFGQYIIKKIDGKLLKKIMIENHVRKIDDTCLRN